MQAFMIRVPSGSGYWSVLDDELQVHPVADRFRPVERRHDQADVVHIGLAARTFDEVDDRGRVDADRGEGDLAAAPLVDPLRAPESSCRGRPRRVLRSRAASSGGAATSWPAHPPG